MRFGNALAGVSRHFERGNSFVLSEGSGTALGDVAGPWQGLAGIVHGNIGWNRTLGLVLRPPSSEGVSV